MIDIAKAAAHCACAACKEFDARPGFTLGVVHSANDFVALASRCPHCGESAAPSRITCDRVGCRDHSTEAA